MAKGSSREGIWNSANPFVQEDDIRAGSTSVEEVLKRLSWAAISVPSPSIDSNELKKSLAGLQPEQLLRIRASAALLENHHRRILEYLQVILSMVYINGYLTPVRVK